MLFVAGCGKPTHADATGDSQRARRVYEGIASFYGPGFEGQETASGRIFDSDEMVAAHRTLPFGTTVRVTNLENRRSVEVVVKTPLGVMLLEAPLEPPEIVGHFDIDDADHLLLHGHHRRLQRRSAPPRHDQGRPRQGEG